MIVPDVNLLLYAEIDAFSVHRAARRWWEDVMRGGRQVGIAPAALFGFLRIGTNRRVFAQPLATTDAIDRVQRWLEQPHVVFLAPGARYLDIALGLLRGLGTAAQLTTDAQIAAHAIEHGGEVFSRDGDFARFEGVRWVNPL